MEKTTPTDGAVPTQNKMGTMPIPKLLFTMSLPMVIAMLVQALYNIVDSVFVSQINENALTAVSLAFPIQNLMIAVATGTGVGVNALLSKSLGEKNYDQAEKAANVSVLLSVCSYIAFALIGIFGSRLFFASQTQVRRYWNTAYSTCPLSASFLSVFSLRSIWNVCSSQRDAPSIL